MLDTLQSLMTALKPTLLHSILCCGRYCPRKTSILKIVPSVFAKWIHLRTADYFRVLKEAKSCVDVLRTRAEGTNATSEDLAKTTIVGGRFTNE